MIAVTSFIRLPWLERLADREHGRALAGVLALRAAGVQEAVELARAAIAFGVGTDVGQTEHPPAEIFRDADFVVGVTAVVDVLQSEMPDVANQAPAAAEIVVSAEVDVARVLGTGDGEVVVDRKEVFKREELPGAADVHLLVVDFAAGDFQSPVVKRRAHAGTRGVGSGVVVIDEADVEAEIAERFFPAAVEIHLEVAAREPRA